MQLEKQVVSLDLAMRLKELGVKQESYFCWHWSGKENEYADLITMDGNTTPYLYSAFTVAELGERLPFKVVIGDAVLWLQINKYELCWTAEYTGVAGTLTNPRLMDAPIKTIADTEADARAKMLIYLVEKKILI